MHFRTCTSPNFKFRVMDYRCVQNPTPLTYSLFIFSSFAFIWSSSSCDIATIPTPPPSCSGTAGNKSSSNITYLLGSGVFLILHARLAYFNVLFVSSKSISLGDIHVIRAVKEDPPRESESRRVSFDER